MSNEVYLRKLNAQELGFRKGEPKKAGRYIYVSKDYLGLFPPLNPMIKNDRVTIDVVPPNSTDIVVTNFVYHNDKIAEHKPYGRNEYRVYLNNDNDPDGDYFQPGDIVAFLRDQGDHDIVYIMYRFPQNTSQYTELENIILTRGAYGSHAVVPISELASLVPIKEKRIARKKIIPEQVQKEIFREPIQSEITGEDKEEITRLVRSTSFRDLVLFFYDYKCAITGRAINYSTLTNITAAHIIPRHRGGRDNPTNGIALNRDFHWAFDTGFYTINCNYKVVVHDTAKDIPPLKEVDGKDIFVPEDSRARPNPEALKWHKENVLGTFVSY